MTTDINPLLVELQRNHAEMVAAEEQSTSLEARLKAIKDRRTLLQLTLKLVIEEKLDLIQAKMIAHQKIENGEFRRSHIHWRSDYEDEPSLWTRSLRWLFVNLGGK